MAQGRYYRGFRDILSSAMYGRSQAQFALDAGISAEHLNRLINNEVIGRPNDTTLKKIARVAENGVTYQDLVDALDAGEGSPLHSDVYSKLRYEEAKKDFCITFREKAEKNFEALANSLISLGAVDCKTPTDYMSKALNKCKRLCPVGVRLDISYNFDYERPYFGHNYKGELTYMRVGLSVVGEFETAFSDLILYKANVFDKTSFFASMKLHDIFEIDGLLPYMAEDLDEVSGGEATEITKKFGEILDREYYVSYAKKRYDSLPSDEARVLDALDGNVSKEPYCISGLGFYTDEIEYDKLSGFIRNHLDDFIHTFAQTSDEFAELKSEAEEVLSRGGDVVKNLAEKLNKRFEESTIYTDKMSYIYEGVSGVMYFNTDFWFDYHEHVSDFDEFKGWLSKKDCIIIPLSYMHQNGITRVAVCNAIVRYGKELGVKRFGEMRYHTVEEYYGAPHTFIIKNDDDNAEVELDREGEWFDSDVFPDEEGVYTTLLKDGREKRLMFIMTKAGGKWIGAHREWSGLVTKWDKSSKTVKE